MTAPAWPALLGVLITWSMISTALAVTCVAPLSRWLSKDKPASPAVEVWAFFGLLVWAGAAGLAWPLTVAVWAVRKGATR